MRRLDQKSKTETEAILAAAKTLLRKQKRSYTELAAHLELSLPSVKRAMNSPTLPLHRILEICEFLGFSLAELLAFARKDANDGFRFTPEQENFLADHPHFLAYFLEALKHSPAEIEKIHGITKRSTLVYLRKLEKLGLLELHPGDLVKHKVRGSIQWDDHGRLGRAYSKNMIEELAQHAVKKIGAPEKMMLEMQGWNLTEPEFSEFKRRYRELIGEYRQLSNFNRKARKKGEALYVNVLTVADFWDYSFTRQVKEIGSTKL